MIKNIKTQITEVPVLLQQKVFPGLDGLRGISIIFVVIGHSIHSDSNWRNISIVGVSIFFVISGFLITSLLLKEKLLTGKISLKNFYIRRCIRILPVAYLYLVVLIALNFIFNLKISFFEFLSAFAYFKNLPFNSDLYTGHFWSLSVEEQFYLIFPFLLRKDLNRYFKIICSIIIFVPVIAFVSSRTVSGNTTIHLISWRLTEYLGARFYDILIGSLFSILIYKGAFKGSKSNNWLGLVLFILAVITKSSDNFWLLRAGNFLFPFLIAYIIILNLSGNTWFNKILRLKLIEKIGLLSYSIYVWQQLFTDKQPWQGYSALTNSLWFNIPLMVLVSWLSYTFYESKILKLKQRYYTNSKPSFHR